jgi:outer membrane protein assembly factor BamB
VNGNLHACSGEENPRQTLGGSRCLFRTSLIAVLVLAFVFSGCGKKAASAPPAKSGPAVKWQFKCPCSAVSHPALANDGTIYFGGNNALFALSTEGKLAWQSSFAFPGTPVLASDGSIYIGSQYGMISGYSPDGKIYWQPKLGMIGFRAPPALGPDNTLYLLNSVADIFALKPPRTDGYEWSRSTFREGLLSGAPPLPGEARTSTSAGKSAPIIARDQSLLVPRQNWLHSLSSSGEDQWTVELTPGSLGLAALAEDGTIYVGDDQSVLYAVDPSGAKKWSFDAESSVIGSPVLDAQGTIYFTAGKSLYALAPDGTIKWKTSELAILTTAPVIAADGTLYVGGEFALFAINPDGSVKWNLRTMTPTSAPSIGQDGTIYFACGYSWMCAVGGVNSPLMRSSWPKVFHDPANTSDVLTGL